LLELQVHWEKFDLGEEYYLNMFKPIPASQMLPDWFKRLGTDESNGKQAMTAKTCRGIYDMMASGYIMRWPFDVKIEKDENGRLFCYKARNGDLSDFNPHHHSQMEGYQDPLLETQREGIQKLKSPFKLSTPEGASILVKQPSYRPELRTTVMEGIIDTDKYYGDFNILFMIKKINTNRKILIKAGTPLAQIIPFVRGEWTMNYGPIDDKKRVAFDDLAENIDKFYQKYQWDRKVFKDETD
jgi:hypothetical protein